MLIILDRDGVINQDSEEYIKSAAEWIPIAGSLAAIEKLNRAGHQVVIATNQSGIARGYFDQQTLHQIHAKMKNQLAEIGGHIDGIYICPHAPADHCECRKPKPGLLQKIGKDFNVDLSQALLIGDSLTDVEAARAVGCKAVLVRSGKPILNSSVLEYSVPDFADLAEVVVKLNFITLW